MDPMLPAEGALGLIAAPVLLHQGCAFFGAEYPPGSLGQGLADGLLAGGRGMFGVHAAGLPAACLADKGVASRTLTKDRQRALAYPELRAQLEGYMVGILKNMECPSLATCAVIDHVHTLFLLSRTESIAHVVQVLKQESSKWIKQQMPGKRDVFLAKFRWQKGYRIFSVSESMIPRVRQYIETQEEHHKRCTFREEYLELLEKHNIEYDERYIWD